MAKRNQYHAIVELMDPQSDVHGALIGLGVDVGSTFPVQLSVDSGPLRAVVSMSVHDAYMFATELRDLCDATARNRR
jgi:hypothetical protein